MRVAPPQARHFGCRNHAPTPAPANSAGSTLLLDEFEEGVLGLVGPAAEARAVEPAAQHERAAPEPRAAHPPRLGRVPARPHRHVVGKILAELDNLQMCHVMG